MRRLFYLVVGLGLGGGAMWGAFNYHVLRTADGYVYIPKQSAQLNEVYLDVRGYGLAEWKQHPQVVQAIVHSGRTELIANAGTVQSSVKDLFQR